jgi:cellulose synthase/poly-beta-1,6-N-acetylglucosamine synthase-like glycosyltransferase
MLLHQENSGKYEAMNLGLKYVHTPLFASLDADSFPEKDALKNIVACFEDSNVTAVSPVLKVFKPSNYIQTIQWLEYSVNHFYKGLITKVNAIHVLPGPLSVYRTNIVKRIGCFRDAHKTEDMEIAMRLQMNGYTLMQCDDAFVYTKAPYTIKNLYKQRHRWNYGTFKNLMHYKKMMFNRKYGDFGMFQLPVILVSGFLGISIIGLLIYDFVKSLKPTFLMLRQYDFNIIEYIVHSRFNIIWLDIDIKSVVTFIGFFVISIFILWMSFKMYYVGGREKDSASSPFSNPFSFLAYLFFYYLFLAVVWLMVFRDIILKKGTEWKGIRGK